MLKCMRVKMYVFMLFKRCSNMHVWHGVPLIFSLWSSGTASMLHRQADRQTDDLIVQLYFSCAGVIFKEGDPFRIVEYPHSYKYFEVIIQYYIAKMLRGTTNFPSQWGEQLIFLLNGGGGEWHKRGGYTLYLFCMTPSKNVNKTNTVGTSFQYVCVFET